MDYKKALPPSKNVEDLRGHNDPKSMIGRMLDQRFDANKRGEPGARRRKIWTPEWYDEERKARYKK